MMPSEEIEKLLYTFDLEVNWLWENQFIIRVPELNLAIPGESYDDAFNALKKHVGLLYEFLSENESMLGQGPMQLLRILRAHLWRLRERG